MAGGKGTRLRPYTNILPKPLLPIGLRSILEINIIQLKSSGVDHIIIAVGYLGELIENVIGDGAKYGLKIEYSYESEPLGTVGGLSLIRDQLAPEFIVMNGDILHNVDFEALHQIHKKSNALATITIYKQQHKVRLGVLEIVKGKVTQYIEKPTKEYDVSMGIYMLSINTVDQYIHENKYLDFPTLINLLIESSGQISSYHHQGLWVDLGVFEDYMKIDDSLEEIREDYPEIPILL